MAKGKKLSLSNNDLNDILNLHNQGLYDYQIAEKYNIGRTTVGKILKNLGIVNRRSSIENKIDKVLFLYNQGKNQNYISKELHMDIHNVRKILRENVENPNKNSWIPKYNINENYFDNFHTENQAYILGLLYSDGSLINNGYSIKLILQEQDKLILEKIRNEIQIERPLCYINTPKETQMNQWGLLINNKHMYNSLLELGLFQNKSLKLKYPNFISGGLQRHFIRGYFDGDGNIGIYKNHIGCSFVGTKEFCNKAKEIIEYNLDIYCGIYSISDNNITCTLNISGNKQMYKFLSWIYDNSELYLERKYNKYFSHYNFA